MKNRSVRKSEKDGHISMNNILYTVKKTYEWKDHLAIISGWHTSCIYLDEVL